MKKLLTNFATIVAAATMTATATSAPLALNANAMNTTEAGSNAPAAPGSAFENATKFPNINFTFTESGVQCGDVLTFSSDNGYSKAISLNHMFYDMGYGNDVIVNVANEEITESGVYTLHVPADFFTLDGNGNDAVDMTWTYTNTSQQGGDDEKELKLTAFTINGHDMLVANPTLDLLERDVPIVIDIDPIPEAVMLTLNFTDKATGENIRSMEIYDNAFNEDIEVDPETGHYKTVVAGRAVNKFFQGKEYVATITGYSTTNAYSAANKTWGPVEVTFEGLSEAYKFSPAKFVSFSPENGAEITDPSTPVIVTFSAPVAEVACEATEGGQGATPITMTDIKPNGDKTVWTITPGASFWRNSACEWTFMISAKDADGLVVEGNHGVEAGSQYFIAYNCFLAWPEVKITPAAGMVEELYDFTVDESRGVGFSWTATPYIVNEAGETVAKADLNSQVQYDAEGRDISTLPMGDFTAVKMTFHLDSVVTTPGKYTFIIPRASFNIGQQYEADANCYMEIEYTVVPMVDVNVELADFAKASFKVSKGNNVNIALTPDADWMLASLTLNGQDVTAQVKDGVYALNATEESNLVASYEFAQEVEVVESGHITGITSAEGKEYKVSNTSECIKIENLQGGEEVNVFTANGMRIATQKATREAMEISVPDGQIYIIMIDKTAFKVVR